MAIRSRSGLLANLESPFIRQNSNNVNKRVVTWQSKHKLIGDKIHAITWQGQVFSRSSLGSTNDNQLSFRSVSEILPDQEMLWKLEQLFVTALLAVRWYNYSEEFAREAFQKQAQADYTWLVCRENGKELGFMTLELKDTEGFAYVAEITVHPKAQRMGVATLLVKKAQERASQINLITRKANEPAINLYKKLGFKHSSFMRNGYDMNIYTGMSWLRSADYKFAR